MLRFQVRVFLALLFFSNTSSATDLSLSPAPLFLGGVVEPNIMFTLDDSGSMQWESMFSMQFGTIMPDNRFKHLFPRPVGLYGSTDSYTNKIPSFADGNQYNVMRSSQINKIFYNPAVTYIPWSNEDGTSMANADPTNALYNPNILYDSTLPDKGGIDLTVEQTQGACWSHRPNAATVSDTDENGTVTIIGRRSVYACDALQTFWPITYYNFTPAIATDNPSEEALLDLSNYTKVQITDSDNTSVGTYPRSREDEIQNFANWFQYYRSRILTARAGIGRAFAKQGEKMRVGFAAINQGEHTVDTISTPVVIDGVRPFSGADKTNFFDSLYGHVIDIGGTPLKKAIESVGKYYERNDNQGPWSKTPGTTDTTAHLQCRQSYNILMTDGEYSNWAAETVGNVDNTAGEVITGPNPDPNISTELSFQYIPENPYKDTDSDTLADIAMHYWKRDLRTDLINRVPENAQDEAFWQHMVTYTVGFGVKGTLDPETDLPELTLDDGETGALSWPALRNNSGPIYGAVQTDDLWHAAVNSRGEYFNASDPDTFADALDGILSSIGDRTSSASSVATTTGSISASSRVYQAKFDSQNWTGKLLAYDYTENSNTHIFELNSNPTWDAAEELPSYTNRVIITSSDNGTGQSFSWPSPPTSPPSKIELALENEDVLNYIRGDQSKEQSQGQGGNFRNRVSLLGDIVHSSPIYVGAPNAHYPDFWPKIDQNTDAPEKNKPYSAFRYLNTNQARQSLVYVGANDGMLHAFNADTGVEKFSYVPTEVYKNLKALTEPDYNHKYFVDGTATVADAFFHRSGESEANWHTVLVSGLGGGGQGIFALDITNPNTFGDEDSAKANVLWEFTDLDVNSDSVDNYDRDVGYVYGTASIVRLHTGDWAAVFSGGYNNTTDDDGDGGVANDSETGEATLYIVGIKDGHLIKKFTVTKGTGNNNTENHDPSGSDRPNGFSSPSVVDFDGDNIVDAIYAGDLFGNVWRMNITGAVNTWRFAYQANENALPEPIFTACASNTCSATNSQAITTQIQVVNHPTLNGYLLLFGTGKYLEVGDHNASGQTTQSFYGIWDKPAQSYAAVERSDLLKQEITKEVTVSGTQYRVSTNNTINWYGGNGVTANMGWYMDLLNVDGSNTDNKGERQVSNAVVRNGRIIFVTILPLDDPCLPDGTSWLMELDLNSGARLGYSPFDKNGDRAFTSDDYIDSGEVDANGNAIMVPASGLGLTNGMNTTPPISDDGEVERKTFSGSANGAALEEIVENQGPAFSGRQSWRELDFNF